MSDTALIWDDDDLADQDVHVDDLRDLAARIQELTNRLRDLRGLNEQERTT